MAHSCQGTDGLISVYFAARGLIRLAGAQTYNGWVELDIESPEHVSNKDWWQCICRQLPPYLR